MTWMPYASSILRRSRWPFGNGTADANDLKRYKNEIRYQAILVLLLHAKGLFHRTLDMENGK